ncbi:MAG: hypothetical protein KME47_06585 [Nodosilinea sp. WJT8-NPBG4]|nr:hypothetical protein [Nodosilinea sp. WJT8-NPBG4]
MKLLQTNKTKTWALSLYLWRDIDYDRSRHCQSSAPLSLSHRQKNGARLSIHKLRSRPHG